MALLREEIERLEQNGITRVAMSRIDDPSVIPLWFGEGDLVTPEYIRDAAKTALDEGFTFYGGTSGRTDLRVAIQSYLDTLYSTDIHLDRITVPGSSMLSITIASQMALSAGDHALLVSPSWPNIDRCFQITGGHYDFVRQELGPDGWFLDLDRLADAIKPNTKAIFVNSPCNPTGWVMSRDEQKTLLEIARARNIVIIADEVYHRNVYDGQVAPSFLQIANEEDPVIVVNGFSKAFAMTGWRLGWMVTPRRYVEQMAVLSECFNTSAPSFVQRAGIVALERGNEFVETLRAQYREGRDSVMRILAPHPHIEVSAPAGAFYAFPKVRGLKSSMDFVQSVLKEEDVGLAPGYTFGPQNEDHFRLCFAQSNARLEDALQRIVNYLDRHDNDFG